MRSPNELYAALLNAYGMPHWWSDDPYIVMLESVLVQNTAWTNVRKTSEALGKLRNPKAITAMSNEELTARLRPCGFARRKAQTIRALTDWYAAYGYAGKSIQAIDQNRLRHELLALPGIGEETADVILVYAFFKPSFILDAYTRRWLERLGFEAKNDDERRLFFETGLKRDATLYGHFHWLILDHSIARCRKTPLCIDCPFSDECNLVNHTS